MESEEEGSNEGSRKKGGEDSVRKFKVYTFKFW